MSDSTNAILQRAQELIENNQQEQAQEVLAPLLETEAENPALWWVYTHAVSDSGIGTAALDRVLQLDPTYPGARELKTDVLAAQTQVAEEIEAQAVPSAATRAIADSGSIDDWEEIKPIVEQAPVNARTGRGFVWLIVALLVVASGVLLVLSGVVDISELTSLLAEPTERPVIVVVEPSATAKPTEMPEPTASPAEAEVSATEEQDLIATVETTSQPIVPPPPNSIAEFISLVADNVSGFQIDEAQSSWRRTKLGETVDLLVCAEPGTEFTARLSGVLDTVVALQRRIPDQVEAIGVSLVNCSDPNAAVRVIGVARDVIDAFAFEEIDRQTFQLAWQPLS